MFDITSLLDEYDTAIETEEVANKVLIVAKLEREVIEARLIYFMQISNINTLEWEGKKLTLKVDLFPNVLVGNYGLLKTFLGEDAKKVFTETPSKLKLYVNKMVDKEDRPVPSFIKLFPKEGLKFKKPKKGN
jgi:hypothetical protein